MDFWKHDDILLHQVFTALLNPFGAHSGSARAVTKVEQSLQTVTIIGKGQTSW